MRWVGLQDFTHIFNKLTVFICKHAPGHTARHKSLNDVSTAFASAGIPATKEPSRKLSDRCVVAVWQTVAMGRDSGSHSGRLVCELDFTLSRRSSWTCSFQEVS